MVRGSDVPPVADALDRIMNANRQLSAFHRERQPGLTHGEGKS